MMRGARFRTLALAAAAVSAAAAWGTAAAGQTTVSREACAAKLRETAARFREFSRLMATEADYAEAHGGEFSPEMTQDLVDWYQTERARPNSDLPALHETNLTPAQRVTMQAATDRFLRQRMGDRQATMAALERDAKQFCARMKDARD